MEKRKPMVSNLALSFRKSVKVSEDAEEVKMAHRETIHELIQQYKEDVGKGKADGIRTAKELIEVMKMDLILMGEVSDRTETVGEYDEVRMTQLTSMIDENDPEIQNLMDDMMSQLNSMNDNEDRINQGVNKPEDKEEIEEDKEEPNE